MLTPQLYAAQLSVQFSVQRAAFIPHDITPAFHSYINSPSTNHSLDARVQDELCTSAPEPKPRAAVQPPNPFCTQAAGATQPPSPFVVSLRSQEWKKQKG